MLSLDAMDPGFRRDGGREDGSGGSWRLLSVIAITHLSGYNGWMPTVLRVGGFRILIFLPPREHQPPHVHVWKADGEVVIELAVGDGSQTIRSVARMRTSDVKAAFWIVEENAEYLLKCWREYHDQGATDS